MAKTKTKRRANKPKKRGRPAKKKPRGRPKKKNGRGRPKKATPKRRGRPKGSGNKRGPYKKKDKEQPVLIVEWDYHKGVDHEQQHILFAQNVKNWAKGLLKLSDTLKTGKKETRAKARILLALAEEVTNKVSIPPPQG